jgi:hypothetical protein
MNQAFIAARTYAKSAFLAYAKNLSQLSGVSVELSDWNLNQMNARFDIHFKCTYKYYYQPDFAFWNSKIVEVTKEFNLKCDFDGENATIKPYDSNNWTTLGSLS